MQTNSISNLKQFIDNWEDNSKYFQMLGLMAKLSKVFSDNDVPYLDYRLAENLFCMYYNAINDARSCTAYDARLCSVGIGIKTFILSGNDTSTEKIAEFNKLKPRLNGLSGLELARQIATFRNDRMRFANDTFNVNETLYHIVGRKKGLLRIFNSPYQEVKVDEISDVRDTTTSISFNDGTHEYTFNKSKSVLMKRFDVPSAFHDVEVDILQEPFTLLEDFFGNKENTKLITPKRKGVDYVVLPLYSVRDGIVQEKAGLNQWNANGRVRDEDEVYIPVPAKIHKLYPDFFPQDKDTLFILRLPDGQELSAKMCQSGLKGLMSNPNKSLGHWILRKVLRKRPGELVTMYDLNRFGIDSICVEKMPYKNNNGMRVYSLSFNNGYENYLSFIEKI